MPRRAHSELCIAALLLPALAHPLVAAAGISVHHDRDGWSAVIKGSLPASQEIRIVAAGDVVVRGSRSAAINYSINQRIYGSAGGSGEKEARTVALQLDAAMERQAGSSRLTVPSLTCATQSVRFDIPRNMTRVTVISQAGSVDVADVAGSVITRNGAGRTVLERIGGNAEVRTAGGSTNIGLVGGNLHCVSGGGPIQARTIRGDSSLETCGGDIYVAEALGAIQAYTGAGSIRIGHAGAGVTAMTKGGPIDVGRAGGIVVARNSGGPIRVVSAPGVRCETASGGIWWDARRLDLHSLANSFLQTGEGDITVLIPSNVGVTLKASCRGRASAIVSDFPVHLVSRGFLTVAEGAINGGGPVLQIAGKDGTITIKRQ